MRNTWYLKDERSMKSSSFLLGVAGGLLRAAPRREAALNPKPYPKSERFGGDPKSEGGRASPSARLRARAREVPHEKFLTRYCSTFSKVVYFGK